MASNRRQFLAGMAATSLAFSSLGRSVADAPSNAGLKPGPLQADGDGVLDLAEGFSYQVLAQTGQTMDDGLLNPGLPDGMAAFPGPDGAVVLVCNHELTIGDPSGPFGADHALREQVGKDYLFDSGHNVPCVGGTTTKVFDPVSGKLTRQFLSLVGTERNCAGGITPRGTWITCEETMQKAGEHYTRDHGWCFEVPADAHGGLIAPVPLKAMGRFQHEAAVTDPDTGVVYLSEDQPDGLLYRFIPQQPDALHRGGKLQALAFRDHTSWDTSNSGMRSEPVMPAGNPFPVRWVDLENVESPDDLLRYQGFEAGAARFARGEGLWFGNGEMFFAATAGGPEQLGQIFRYRPSPFEGQRGEGKAAGTLALHFESSSADVLANVDNLTTSPWGDLILCEDRHQANCRIIGLRPDGSTYILAANPYNPSEFAGACFAPDGQILFVNLQGMGLTLAIRGPFPA